MIYFLSDAINAVNAARTEMILSFPPSIFAG
jgi:hypothetical protein